ncbi:hypothetical protein HDU97_002866 [Phlyctochytrium planicorne]|nr:hypothetical protein HDU97_002866 [Phlyctochytrium planicorne]
MAETGGVIASQPTSPPTSILPTLSPPSNRAISNKAHPVSSENAQDRYDSSKDDNIIAPAAGPSLMSLQDGGGKSGRESGRVTRAEINHGSAEKTKDPWAYRAYQPTLPCANKLLQQKFDSVAQKTHAMKIKNASATVDTAPPKKYSHLVSQKRKMRTKMEQAQKLLAENKNLLRRIKRQINTASLNGLFPTPAIKSAAPSGDPVIHTYGINGPRNRLLRDQTKRENELILQRLEASEPHYSHEDFEKDRIHTLLYLQNISRFPARYKKELEALGPLPVRPTTPTTNSVGDSTKSGRPKSAPTPSNVPRPPTTPNPTTKIIKLNGEVIEVPKRWSPRSPAVPRVAQVRPRPRSAPTEEEKPKEPEKPKAKGPLVPRVAYLAKKPDQKSETSKPRMAPVEDLISSQYPYEDSFPGDEEMYLTGDSLSLMSNTLATSSSPKPSSSGKFSDSEESMRGLLMGNPGFASTFALPDPTSTSVKVYLSSLPDDMKEEREKFMEYGIPQIRETCLALGVEFRAVDMRWGLEEMWVEPAMFAKVSLWELERSTRESMSVSSVVFFGKSAYGNRTIPFEMDQEIFQRILKQARRLEESPFFKSEDFSWAVGLLERCYQLDETFVPPKRIMRPLGDILPEFNDPAKRHSAWKYWKEIYFPALQRVLRSSVVYLGRKHIVEPSSVQKLVQSGFQEEVVRGVLKQTRRGSWERGVLVTNAMGVGEGSSADELVDPFNEAQRMARSELRLLAELWNNLFAAVPYENRILKKLDIEDEDESRQIVVEELTDVVKKLVTRSLSFRVKTNALAEEILVHAAYMRTKAKDHIRRQHLVDKVINYMTRTETWALPPFLIHGEASMGRTSLLAKALQKYAMKWQEGSVVGNVGSATSRGESPLPPPLSERISSAGTSLSTPSLAASIRRRRSTISSFRPIVIVRVAGLTPDSSSPATLMASLTRQICAAYSVAVDDNDEITVEVFREALHLASPERPLIIVIAKVERLPSDGPSVLRLSWLVDGIPPYVRIILSSRDEKKSGVSAFVKGRITLAAPGLIAATAKASGLPQLDSDVASVSEQFLLKTGDLILPVVKASIKKWMDLDGRKLRVDQTEAIVKAFQSSSPTDSGGLCIRMLKCLYNTSRKWKVSDNEVPNEFPTTVQEYMDQVLTNIEDTSGLILTKTALSLIYLSRDGLTQSELEDLLSLDDEVLKECYKWQGAPKMRIPYFSLSRLLQSLNEFVFRRNSWGGELFSFTGDADFRDAVKARYLSEGSSDEPYLELLAKYFMGTYYEGYSESKTGGEGLWNVRKLRELPYLLARNSAWTNLSLLIEDLDFVQGLREALSISKALEDIYNILCIGSSQNDIEFDRYASKIEATFDVLTWIRSFLAITPSPLQRQVFLEQLLRLPPQKCPLRLDDDVHKALQMTGWNGFERLQQAGLGSLQCDQLWKPDLRCGDNLQKSYSDEQLSSNQSHDDGSHLRSSMAQDPRFKKMIQSTRDCDFYGKRDEKTLWKKTCLRPYTSFIHRRHVLLTTSPDGKYIGSLCVNGTVRVYDSSTYVELWNLVNTGRVTAFNFQPSSSNCEYLLTAGSGGITRWSLEKGIPTAVISGKRNGISSNVVSCGFVADAKDKTHNRAYALFVTGHLVIWDLEATSILKCMPPDEDDNEFFSYGSACTSPDGKYLVFGSKNVKLLVCNTLTQQWTSPLFSKSLTELKMHRVTHIRFSEDSSSFYVVSNFGTKEDEGSEAKQDNEWRGIVQRWELQSKSSRILSRLSAACTSLSVSNDNRLLAIGCEDGNIDILNAFSGTRIGTEAFAHSITSVAFIPDLKDHVNEHCRAGSQYYIRKSPWVGVGSIDMNDPMARLSTARPTSYRLCTGSIDGVIRVLGVQKEPEGNGRTPISAARLSPDGKFVLIVGGGEYDNYNMLPSCFMKNQRNESKVETFRNRLASTAVLHRQDSLELINDLVLGASKVRTKSEAAWEASSVTLAVAAKNLRSMSAVGALREDHFASKKIKSVINSTASTKPPSPIPGEEAKEKDEGNTLKSGEEKAMTSQLSMYDLALRPVETTAVTMYDVATAKQVCSFSTRGEIIWCDFERNPDGSIRAIITGDRSGTVRFWWIGPVLRFEDGSLKQREYSSTDIQVEVFDMKVMESAMSNDLVVGYSLNHATMTLAVAYTFDPSDFKKLPDNISMENQTTTGLVTMIDFWDFDTNRKLDSLSISVDALPCILSPSSNPLLSLTWSLPSDDIARFYGVQFEALSDNPVAALMMGQQNSPSALGVGPMRLYMRPADDLDGKNTQWSTPVKSIIEQYVGSDAAAKCTSSCQSKYDPKILILGFGDLIFWICEERFPVIVKIQQSVEPAASKSERGSRTERVSDQESKAKANTKKQKAVKGKKVKKAKRGEDGAVVKSKSERKVVKKSKRDQKKKEGKTEKPRKKDLVKAKSEKPVKAKKKNEKAAKSERKAKKQTKKKIEGDEKKTEEGEEEEADEEEFNIEGNEGENAEDEEEDVDGEEDGEEGEDEEEGDDEGDEEEEEEEEEDDGAEVDEADDNADVDEDEEEDDNEDEGDVEGEDEEEEENGEEEEDDSVEEEGEEGREAELIEARDLAPLPEEDQANPKEECREGEENVVVNDITISLIQSLSPLDHCRIRRIVSPQGESVISLYHLKSRKVDAILAATDAGTISVYDLSISSQWSPGSEWGNGQEILEDCPVLAIWHARTPLLGMQAVEVEGTPSNPSSGNEKSRWKVVVWGRNGFCSILSLQL